MESACAERGVPLAAAAIQLPLRYPVVRAVLVGTRSSAEVAEDVDLLDHPIPEELWEALASI
jgi:D-threo-aldose 1-dehydrogenase